MRDPSAQMQSALFEVLNGDATLAAMFEVIKGGRAINPRIDFEGLETHIHDTENTYRHIIEFSVWTDLYDLIGGTDTAARLRTLLDDVALTLSDYDCVYCRFSSMSSEKDVSSRLWQHKLRFESLTQLKGT